MSDTRKKEIIMATLELAANKGLGNVSMNMIADKVGIKKPSLYNHFASKEELVEAMYQFLREEAKKNANVGAIDYTVIFAGKSALEILRMMVGGYFHMNQQEHMLNFYKVIYSERSIQPMAAKILAEETEKMIIATKQLFYAMEVHKLLHFQNADMSAVSFAMTVHGLMDYELDLRSGGCKTENKERNDLDEYLQWFCKENAAYPGYNWMAQAVSNLSGSDAHFVNGNRCIVIYHITNLNHYFRDKKQKLLFLWGICRNSTWNDDGWCIRYEHCSERVFWNSREVQCFCSNRFSGGFGNAPL